MWVGVIMERIINILADAEILGQARSAYEELEIDLGTFTTAQDVERLAWAMQELTVFNTPVGGVDVDVAEFTKALFTPEFCKAWPRVGLVWSPLKHGGLVSNRIVRERALSLCAEARSRNAWSHAGRSLQVFAEDRDRRHTVQPGLRTWGKWQDFFDNIGERYQCVYCMNNHECMVKGCSRRPSDSYCENYNVRGKTFRFEFRHQDDGIGGKIHACGKCAKSMLFFKKELVNNWEKSKASWATGKTRREPREHAFHKCELKDGRVYHIDRCGDPSKGPAPWCLFFLKHAEHNPKANLVVKNLESTLCDNGLDRVKKLAALKAYRQKLVATEMSALRLEMQRAQRAQLARIREREEREREERERAALKAEHERRRAANTAAKMRAEILSTAKTDRDARAAAKNSRSLVFMESFFSSRRYKNNLDTNHYTRR